MTQLTAAADTRLARALALAVLAAGSLACTTHLVRSGEGGSDTGSTLLPDGRPLPTEELEQPASYSARSPDPRVANRSGARIVAASSLNGIPSAALAAYQRAETVINSADKACHIPWQLIAAIGRVESDHGRYGGNTLGVDGVSRPGIYGIPLDGTHGTAEISDTDAGQYDNDAVWDRAVGPMQFIPSTWSVVGVDADGDAKRNPQDIDDAALAAAVYLCSGPNTGSGANLSTRAGRRKSVFRYNHSDEYVDLVLSVMDRYLRGDYASIPTRTTSAITFTPDYSYTTPKKRESSPKQLGSATGSDSTTEEPSKEPTLGPTPAQTGEPVASGPIEQIQMAVKDVTSGVATTVDDSLTLAQATLRCMSLGYSPLLTRTAWNACLAGTTRP